MAVDVARVLRRSVPWLAGACFLLAAVALARRVRALGLDAIGDALFASGGLDLAVSAACAAGSYLVLTGVDWLGVRSVGGARLAYPRVALAAFSAVSVGHLLGFAALSGGAIRYRLYERSGLRPAAIARVILFAGTTVAVGLAGVAGAAGLLRPRATARLAGLPAGWVVALGAAAWLAVGVYVVLAHRVRGEVRVLGHAQRFPSARVALLQVAAGCANYVLCAACLHRLVAPEAGVGLLAFASLYAVGNALVILSHVPAGVGVLEAVVLAAVPGADVLAALIVFRLVYHVVPFVLGAGLYALSELRPSARPAGRRRS